MTDILDQRQDDRLLEEFWALSEEQMGKVFASWWFKRVYRLAVAKRTTGRPIMPMNDSEPDEEELYQHCRQWFFDSLRMFGREDLVDRAMQFLPDRLLDITNGGGDSWDYAAARDMSADLTVICARAGLTRYKHVLSRRLCGIDLAISNIANLSSWLAAIAFELHLIDEVEWPPATDDNQLSDCTPVLPTEKRPGLMLLAPQPSAGDGIPAETPRPQSNASSPKGRTGLSQQQVEAAMDAFVRLCDADPPKRAVLNEFLLHIEIPLGTWKDWMRKWETNYSTMLDQARERVSRRR